MAPKPIGALDFNLKAALYCLKESIRYYQDLKIFHQIKNFGYLYEAWAKQIPASTDTPETK